VSYTKGGGVIRRRSRNVRRTPRNRPKPNYPLLLTLFFISMTASGVWSFVVQTPMLVVKEIKITGVTIADKAIVTKSAKSALGKNIITLHKTPILSQIRNLHEVKDVRISRSLPDKIWIHVTEREPDAVVVGPSGCCMVQLDGLVFHSVSKPVSGIPTVDVAKNESLKLGCKCNSPRVLYALSVLNYARKARLEINKISVDQLGDMCLNMRGGFYVKLGQPDEIARKMSILRETLVYRPSIGKEAAYIDLSCPSAPVWKPKTVISAAS